MNSSRVDPPRFRHDGTATGRLCAIAAALRAGPGAVLLPPDPQPTLFEAGTVPVAARESDAAALLGRIERQLGRDWTRRTLRILCSEEPGCDALALESLRLAFDRGSDVMGYQAHPVVRRAAAVERRVSTEAHRLKGLLRFRRLATGRLWGPVEPRHDILPLLTPHFRSRLAEERWLIHDAARGYGAGCDPGRRPRTWTEEEIAGELRDGLDASESGCQDLWKSYFGAISVRGRDNPRAQRRNMPARYWRCLVEMEDRRPREPARR